MRRLAWSAVLLAGLTGLFVPGATGAPAMEPAARPSATEWLIYFEARFSPNRFPGGGRVTSVIGLYGTGACNPELPDVVSTRITGRPPGEIWKLEIYDRGTCDHVTHVLVTLPSIRIGSGGERTSHLTRPTFGIEPWQNRLYLRLSIPGYHTCQRYYSEQLGP